MRSTLPLALGHAVNGVLMEFPHLCPGEDCAIAAWLCDKLAREGYESLIDKRPPSQWGMHEMNGRQKAAGASSHHGLEG